MLLCRVEVVLGNPGNKEIADWLDFNDDIEETNVCDLVIIREGLWISCYSIWRLRGLVILVLKINTPCEQAGRQDKRFRIQIYLGFPSGPSRQDHESGIQSDAKVRSRDIHIQRHTNNLRMLTIYHRS
jgi:thioredoxin reductase (NADPH)